MGTNERGCLLALGDEGGLACPLFFCLFRGRGHGHRGCADGAVVSECEMGEEEASEIIVLLAI